MTPGALLQQRLSLRALRVLQDHLSKFRQCSGGPADVKAKKLQRELAGVERALMGLGRKSKQLVFK